MFLCNSTDCGSKSVLALKKPTFLGEAVKIGLLYRSPNFLSNSFLENLTPWIDEEKPAILHGYLYWMKVYLIMVTLQGHSQLIKYQLQ